MTTTPQTEAQRLADEALVEFQCGALSVLTGRKMIDELLHLDAENSDLRERNAALGNAQEIALDTATEHALVADELRDRLAAAEAERDQLRAQVERLQEPVSNWPLKAKVWKRENTQEWVLDIEGTLGETNMTCRHTQPLSVAYEDVPGLPTLYREPVTQARDEWVSVDERAAFESEMRSRHGWNNSYFTQSNDGGYLSNRATHAYIGWQARAAMAQGVKG